MNSDKNKLKEHVNFSYTPVMMMFKKEYKDKAYKYCSNTIYDQEVFNFFEVTRTFSLLDYSLFKDSVKKKESSNYLLREMLKNVY